MLKSVFIFGLLAFQIANAQPSGGIDDTIEDFDAIVDQGNPADEAPIIKNTPGATMPEKSFQAEQNPQEKFTAPTVSPTTTAEEDFESEIIETNPEPLPLIRQNKGEVVREKNRRYIEHPNADKGLIKIDKDRVYYYKQEQSEKQYSVAVTLGTFDPSNLQNPDNPSYRYSDIYDESSFPMILFNYEKPLFKNNESLKYYLGGGFFLAQGTGQFDTTGSVGGQPAEEPQEQFTLFVFPLSAGVNWHLDFFKNQWLVPYAGGGLTAFVFGERRDDDLNPALGAKWGISPAAHFQGGGAFKLGRGPRAFLDLDREYGINSMWLTLEYRNFTSLSDKFDFSSDFIGGGLYLVY